MKFALASLLLCGCLLVPARAARADSYYVTVAGLGGEPDYDQRFTELAHDLDTVFKASGSTAHVYTLTEPTRRARTSVTRSARWPIRPSWMTTLS